MIPTEIAHDRTVSASTTDSIFGGFDDMFGQDNQRAKLSDSHTTFDRAGGWNTDDGHFSDAATNSSAQQALAAATEEVERLTAAVKSTIHELERIRGSVQPPLPALPVNRGVFRIS
jgi:hypothetical protein